MGGSSGAGRIQSAGASESSTRARSRVGSIIGCARRPLSETSASARTSTGPRPRRLNEFDGGRVHVYGLEAAARAVVILGYKMRFD
jgi:hypothetical protein